MYDQGTRYVTVAKMRELIAALPENYELEVNKVGNLLIYHDGVSLGYIDLGFGESVEWWPPEPPK